ncbi:MAG: tetratricopeptide repeat protein [Flavobacteriales bacterium]|jgi:tetratricopeptide (TPR) repeat protein|tara:strand:- start:4534 stop:5292 length:759 start_codon:yes stop_codon:yes gene_type:complete
MKKIVVIIYLIFSGLVFSQTNNNEYFSNGIDLYNNGKYNEAIVQFKLIIENKEHSEALYFNLGNSYYKINDIANSIYFYEKALKLNPKDRDILNNLAFSQNMLIDKVEKLPRNQVSDFLNNISKILNVQQWLIVGFVFWYFFLATFLLYFFNTKTRLKKNYFTLSAISFIISILFIINGVSRFENNKNTISAIIFEKKIDFRTEPNFRSEILFNLHEGTKVIIKEELNEWGLIEISDGNKGWVELKSIKKIN